MILGFETRLEILFFSGSLRFGGFENMSSTFSRVNRFASPAQAHLFAIMTAAAKLPAHVAAQSSMASPNLLKEIFHGIDLGIFSGSFWKVHHLNERRKTEEFYARLNAGEITVAAQE